MEDWAGEGRERNLKHSFLSPDSNFVNLSGNFKLLFFKLWEKGFKKLRC